MLDNIGNVAGAVWHYLEENDEATVTKLTRENSVRPNAQS